MTDTFYNRPMSRKRTDTTGAPPRALIRVYLSPGQMVRMVPWYEELQGIECDAFFPYPETGLFLAMVGSFLLIEGSETALAPFRDTRGTLLVSDVEPIWDRFIAEGVEIVRPIRDVPTGRGFTARHPDGTIIEYVHHRPDPLGH